MIPYLADTPIREVKAEEIRLCPACHKNTKHRYEEISFHANVLFVKVFCYKKRYVRICEKCNNGEEMDKEAFEREISRLLKPGIYFGNTTYSNESYSTATPRKPAPAPPKSPLQQDVEDNSPRYRIASKKGIKYCRECGQKIYPDIGYCTSCAVRGDTPVKSRKSIKKRKRK